MRVITGICVFVGSLLVTSSCPGAPLVISETGVAKAVILLPAAPTNLETFAAGELADCLGRMSGDTFQVTKEGSGPGQNQPVISIGKTRLSGNLEMQGPPGKIHNREAFRVVRRGNALFICGNRKGDACDLGTLWGVYGFLQKLGVGWYLEDPLFEVVPDKPTLSVESMDFTDAPSMEMRGSGGQARGVTPNHRHKRPGYGAGNGSQLGYPSGGREVWFSHMLSTVLTSEVLKENPEFTKDGGRCMTNPKLRELFVDHARSDFLENPTLYASSLFPDDNTGPTCSCPECQQLLNLGEMEQTVPGARSKSDYLVDFYNGVARGLEKEFPDRKVIGAAYLHYLNPPTQTRLHPNVIILLAPLTDPTELHPATDGMVRGWRAMGANELYWYGYDMGLEPMPNEIARRYRNYRQWNLEGVYIEQRPNPAVSGINYYLEAELSWNWDANVDDLLQQFCYELFGPEAGRMMVDFWYAWEQKNYLRARQLIGAAKAIVANNEVKTKRVRYFELGFQIVDAGREMHASLKNEGKKANLSQALAAARKCVAARDSVNTDYGPGLGYRETSGHGRYVGGVESMIPALEKIAAFNPPKLPQMELSPGPLLVLTDNADEPGEKRLATGVTVTYDPPANWIKDNPAPPSKLFNIGSDKVVPASVVGTFGPPDGVWNITLDLKKTYEVDKVELWLRSMLPVYVEVSISTDGDDFEKIDQILPAEQIGWFRTRDLGVEARYVRLTMGTTDNVKRHLIHQVKVWGRELTP
jgi:hypothetical protein